MSRIGFFDKALAWVNAVTSTLGSTNGSVLYNLQGLAAGDDDPDAETSNGEEFFDSPGVIFRARDQDASGGVEGIAARLTDGLTMFAARDLRINAARGNVNKGHVGIAAYGKAFLGFDDAPSGGGNVFLLYVPYDFNSQGGAQKAHAITVDSTTGSESISMLHGKGQYIALHPDGSMSMVSPNGQNFVTVSDDGVAFSGGVKAATGLVAGDVPHAQPVLVGTAGGTWAAQITTAMSQIAAKLNATGPVVGAPGTVTPVTAAPPSISTKVSASP